MEEEQLNNFFNLINRKNIDYSAIRNYLLINKLNDNVNCLSFEEFNNLLELLNTPDIKVGDTVHFIPEYSPYKTKKKRRENILGIVTNITRNDRCIGNEISIEGSNVRYAESWIKEGTPFVKKYIMRRIKEDK